MKKIRAISRALIYHSTLQTKIIFCCSLLIFLAITVLGTYSIQIMQDFSIRQTETSVEELLEEISSTLSAKVTKMISAADSISSNQSALFALQNTESSPYQRYSMYLYVIDPLLNSIMSMNEDFSSLTIYQNNPVLVTHSKQVRELAEVVDEAWVDSVTDYSFKWRIDDQKLCLNTRLPSLYIGAPLLLLDVRIDESIVFNMSFDIFEEYVMGIRDEDGTLIWSRNLLSVSDEEARQLLTAQRSSTADHLGHYQRWHIPVSGVNWSLDMVIPHHELTVSTTRFTRTMIGMIFICFLLILPLTILTSSYLVKRINHLNETITKVADGQMDIIISTPYQDEVGTLTQNFNHMLEALRCSMREQTETEKRQKEAEMRALRAQINPHFLYNTLSLISWKAMDQNAEQVARIARTFSRFCRTVLNRGMTESRLSEEIMNVNCYVEIQREMHDNSFDITYDIDEAYMQYVIPNFVLQPVVENAIVHGVETVRNLRGKLHIDVKRQNGDLICRVLNNGTPFEEEVLQNALASKEKSYGLRNVQERVQYLYGSEYGIFLGEPDEGYTTCVVLKLKINDPSEENRLLEEKRP